MSHFRNTLFIDESFIAIDRLYICGMFHDNIRGIGRKEGILKVYLLILLFSFPSNFICEMYTIFPQ